MARTTLAFLILPEVHILDLAGPVQVFQEAMDHGVDLSLVFCAAQASPRSTCGITLGSMKPYRKVSLQRGDFLLVPGASMDYLIGRTRKDDADLLEWVAEAHTRGVIIASVCTGAFFLGQAGLLNGRRCTTHWKRADQLQKRYPRARVEQDILFTEDDGIITSAGVTAGIDMALHIVGRLQDEMVAYKVARELVVYLRRNGNEPQQSIFMQYRNHIHSGIHRVQDYLHENLHQGANLPALSEVACMSTRNLTRTFKREAGITINRYINLVRQVRLRELTKNPNFTRKQLARYCGLRSERQVIRLLNTLPAGA